MAERLTDFLKARLARWRRGRIVAEHGFSIVELLVAIIILSLGIVGTMGVFTSSKSATVSAQRAEVAVHQAQREMEKLRALNYDSLGLAAASAPAASSDQNNPNWRVQGGGYFRVKTVAPTLDEELVLLGSNSNGKVALGPEAFTVGSGSSATSGTVYRYITWRDEQCPATICDGTRNTKRLIVGISLDPKNNLGPLKPVWISSIATDPNQGPLGQTTQPPPPPGTSGQNFYLYDKTCVPIDTSNTYATPTATHATHDTASDTAACEHATATKRPDLMGPTLPTNASPPLPPYTYSSDLSGDYPAGLAMVHRGSVCPVSSYTASDSAGKWSLHGWATRKFTQDFNLSGTAVASLWTTSVGSAAGSGTVCATLIDRISSGGAPSDVVLGSMSRQYSPWPTTKSEPGLSCGAADFPCGRQLTFQFSLTGTKVRSGGRLMLVLSVLGSSDKDIVLLYDDPRYRSLLEVETTTPCQSSGAPCLDS